MSKNIYEVEKHEIWRKSVDLVKEIYRLSPPIQSTEIPDLISILHQASISISSNIAEAIGSFTDRNKNHYYQISSGKTYEVINLLCLAKELDFLNNQDYLDLRAKCDELTNLLYDLIKSVPAKTQSPDFKLATPNSQLPTYYSHPTAIIDPGATIGKETKIWHFCHVMSKAIIGEGCSLGQNVFVADGVVIGNNVKIQNNVSLYTGVECQDDVFLGPSMVFTNVINPRSGVNRKNEYAETIVHRGASIGANATIVCGNPIGLYAFIGAGAVVTKAIPDYALVVGNPARQIGWMSEHGHRLSFDIQGKAICPGSGNSYELKNNQVTKL